MNNIATPLQPNMTYLELYEFLKDLHDNQDTRLQDKVVVYAAHDGEYRPADITEFVGDNDILDNGRLFIMTTDEY